METTDPNQLDEEYDVIVAGGGAASLAAAVSSARDGMKTLLLAKLPSIGGLGGSTLVHSLCGFHRPSPDLIPRPANGGFAMEFAERLAKAGCAAGPLRVGPYDVFLNEPMPYTRFCHDFCRREKNLDVALETRVDSIEGSDSRFERILLEGRTGPLRAKAFVDTTREAELAFLGGADYETSMDRPVRRRTFVFCVSGQDLNATGPENMEVFSERIVRAILFGTLTPQIALAAIKIARVDREWNACIRLNEEGDHFSALNRDSLIRFQILGTNLAKELAGFLRSNVPGFEKCLVEVQPATPCAPESRRLVGRHRLAIEDLRSASLFEDEVCRLGWPVMADPMAGFMPAPAGKSMEPPGMPLRALLSNNIGNLVAAGRCASSSYTVQGALRTAGAALSIGQAAGLAAAEIARSPDGTIPGGMENETALKIRAAVEKGL